MSLLDFQILESVQSGATINFLTDTYSSASPVFLIDSLAGGARLHLSSVVFSTDLGLLFGLGACFILVGAVLRQRSKARLLPQPRDSRPEAVDLAKFHSSMNKRNTMEITAPRSLQSGKPDPERSADALPPVFVTTKVASSDTSASTDRS
jgi:hypothetical protein